VSRYNQDKVEAMLPPVSDEHFGFNNEARFWVGRVATKSVVDAPGIHDSLLQFRGNVYVRECGFLPENSLDSKGRESDSDDLRSLLFSAVEKYTDDGETGARVVGSSRIIMKDSDQILPIENYFPEVFKKFPAEGNISSEISRYIARHPNKFVQGLVSLALVRAMFNVCIQEGIENAYAMLEEKPLNKLRRTGIEANDIGSSKYIAELKGVIQPVVFRPFELVNTLYAESADVDQPLTASQIFFQFDQNKDGHGFYNEDLMRKDHDIS